MAGRTVGLQRGGFQVEETFAEDGPPASDDQWEVVRSEQVFHLSGLERLLGKVPEDSAQDISEHREGTEQE